MTTITDRKPCEVTILRGRTRAECVCSWAADDPDPGRLARAVAAHVGLPMSSEPRCHAICYDDHGHTDGCIVDTE